MLKKPTVSIIIVNYNTKELTKLCLESLFQAKSSEEIYDVIVVDNASTDDSVVMLQTQFPQVRLVQKRQNVGFAKGNNDAVRIAKAEYILFLNSDTQVQHGTISSMLDYLRGHPDVGVVTCKLVLPDGTIDPACHRGFPTPWASLSYFLGFEKLFPRSRLFAQYHQGYKDLSTIHEIDCPSGAFFFTKRAVIHKVGVFDEDYFMYGEDVDWAYRIKKTGYKIVYNPQKTTIHVKKQSGRSGENKTIKKETQRYFYETMDLFYQKHYQAKYPAFITLTIRSLIKLRIVCLRILNV